MQTIGKGTGTAWSKEPRIQFSELPNLAVAERPRLWGQGLYRSTPLCKAQSREVFPSSLVSAGSPRDRTLNSGRLAQPCFWHFVSPRALEHLWDVDLLDSKVIEILDSQTEIYQYVQNSMAPHPARDYVVLR